MEFRGGEKHKKNFDRIKNEVNIVYQFVLVYNIGYLFINASN